MAITKHGFKVKIVSVNEEHGTAMIHFADGFWLNRYSMADLTAETDREAELLGRKETFSCQA